MPSLVKELTPTRVDLHRNGHISVHYRVAVRNSQTFVFSIPSAHATRALAHIRLRDTRGTHPSLTLAAPPLPDVADPFALPRWLRMHVGREVEVRPSAQRGSEPWKLVGVLEGFRKYAEWARPGGPSSKPTAESEDTPRELVDQGPYVIFVRVGDATVARTVHRIEELEIRLKVPEHSVAVALPDAARANGVIPVNVDTSGDGDGQLHISYHAGFFAKPLYELRYELDAVAVLHGGMKRSKAQVACSVRIPNYLPFPLRNSMVCLKDEFMRQEPDDGFEYEVEHPPLPHQDDSDDSDSDEDEPRGWRARDDMNFFRFKPTETTETSHFKQAAFERLLRERVTLQPGEIFVTHLFNTSVDISGVHCMTEHDEPEPTIRIQNTTGGCLEAGSWSIRHGAHSLGRFTAEALLPGAVYNAAVSECKIITVHKSSTVRRLSHRAVALRGESLVVRDERSRELIFELANQDEHSAHEVYVLVEFESERRLRAPTAARLFDGVKTTPWDRGSEPEGLAIDEPFGFIRFSFRVEPAHIRTLVVRQTVRNESRVALRRREVGAKDADDPDADDDDLEIVDIGHVERLRRAGAPEQLVLCLRDVIRLRRELAAVDWTRARLHREASRVVDAEVKDTGPDCEGDADRESMPEPEEEEPTEETERETEDGTEGDSSHATIIKTVTDSFVDALRRKAARRVSLLHAADELEMERSDMEEKFAEMVQQVRVALAFASERKSAS